MSDKSLTLTQIQDFKGKYPKQIWFMFLVEMWERFCFYGMRGVLTIFMIDKIRGGLGLGEGAANLQYGGIQAFVYAFTFLGGFFADKILGFKRSLVFGALVMITGNFLIASNPGGLFYLGIACSVIGTGFFKPNITSMVGALYKSGDTRRDAGFSLFYSGINLGGLLGGSVCVYLGKSEHFGWSYAFASAGIVMICGLITFLITKKYLGPIGNKPGTEPEDALQENAEVVKVETKKNAAWKEYAVYAGAIASIPLIQIMIKKAEYTANFMLVLLVAVLVYFIVELIRQKDTDVRPKLIAAFIFIFFYFVFESIFEQSGGSLNIFASQNVSNTLFGFIHLDPNIVNNSANTFFIIFLGLIMGSVWFALNKRKMEPNTIVKFGLAFLFMAATYYCYYALRFTADSNGANTSLGLFIFAYFVVSVSEICLSPIGMSVVTKLSPSRMHGVMIGMWFLASAYGQYGAGWLGARMSAGEGEGSGELTMMQRLLQYTHGYQMMAVVALVAGILLIACSPLIKKLMRGVK